MTLRREHTGWFRTPPQPLARSKFRCLYLQVTEWCRICHWHLDLRGIHWLGKSSIYKATRSIGFRLSASMSTIRLATTTLHSHTPTTKWYNKEFRCLQFYCRDMMYEICNVSYFPWRLERTCTRPICLIQILKVWLILYIYVECFIMFIFSILLTWNRDFWTSFILSNQTI